MIDNIWINIQMELTVEQVYKAIYSGVAKYEKGDIYYDWMKKDGWANRLKYNSYNKIMNVDQHIHDLEIWCQCSDILDDDDNAGKSATFDLLFSDCYDWKVESRLKIITEMVEGTRDYLLQGDIDCIDMKAIVDYKREKAFLKAWSKHLVKKGMLIDQLPLCKDVREIIKEL